MSAVMEIAVRGGGAFLQMLLHPFYYVGILFILLHYRRQIAFERRLYATKLHSLLGETGRTVIWGLAGGLAATAAMGGIGATLQPEAVWLIWGLSLLLILFRVRFFCWAYAIGAIGVLQAVFGSVPMLGEWEPLAWLSKPLLSLHMPAMLALVAILHLIEALFVRFQGSRFGTPMFYESKRGKIVGGYQLQGFWPVPLVLLVPYAGGEALPWTPLLGGDGWQHGWALVGFPVMIGFTEMTMSRLPAEKVRISSNLLLVYAAAMLLFAWLAHLAPALTLTASLLCVLLHEGIIWYSRWDESRRSPIYVHGGNGLKILGVLPGSPAAELGLVAGEAIRKVNGVAVRTKQEMYEAMQLNAAYCKLEVVNLAGESKFLKRALFSGEHHQLGIILAPDQDALYYAESKPLSFFAYVRRRLVGLLSNKRSQESGKAAP